jgi:hypothetical protein
MSANRKALHSSAVTATVNGVETGVADLGAEGYFSFCRSVSISIMFLFSYSSLIFIYVCTFFCIFSNNAETGIADWTVDGRYSILISLIRLDCHSMPPPAVPRLKPKANRLCSSKVKDFFKRFLL